MTTYNLDFLISFLANLSESGLTLVCHKDTINGRLPCEAGIPGLATRLVALGLLENNDSGRFCQLIAENALDVRNLYPEGIAEALAGQGHVVASRPLRTRVINLFGAPSSGKTTVVAEVFANLKKAGRNAFQIQEYATYLIVSGRVRELTEEQDLIFAKQKHKQEIARGKFEFAVTESPLLLSSYYAPPDYPGTFHAYALSMWNTFDNLSFYLRKKDWSSYDSTSRIHSKSHAMRIEEDLPLFLRSKGVDLIDIPLDVNPADWITRQVLAL